MKLKKENGITLISLAIMMIVIVIITGIVITTGLDGANSVDKSKETGMLMEKKSIMDALQVDIENLRVNKLLYGKEIDPIEIEDIMRAFVDKKGDVIDLNKQTKELTYEDGKIKSTKGFEITVEEMLAVSGFEIAYSGPHEHDYRYYDSQGTDKGTTHPTLPGTYTYRCNCGIKTNTHTVTNKSINDYMHTVNCSICGSIKTENHNAANGITYPQKTDTSHTKANACSCGMVWTKIEAHNDEKGFIYSPTSSETIRTHTMNTVCSCGAYWNTKTNMPCYIKSWTRRDDTDHRGQCTYCKAYKTEAHSWPYQGTGQKCTKCSDIYGISGA